MPTTCKISIAYDKSFKGSAFPSKVARFVIENYELNITIHDFPFPEWKPSRKNFSINANEGAIPLEGATAPIKSSHAEQVTDEQIPEQQYFIPRSRSVALSSDFYAKPAFM